MLQYPIVVWHQTFQVFCNICVALCLMCCLGKCLVKPTSKGSKMDNFANSSLKSSLEAQSSVCFFTSKQAPGLSSTRRRQHASVFPTHYQHPPPPAYLMGPSTDFAHSSKRGSTMDHGIAHFTPSTNQGCTRCFPPRPKSWTPLKLTICALHPSTSHPPPKSRARNVIPTLFRAELSAAVLVLDTRSEQHHRQSSGESR